MTTTTTTHTVTIVNRFGNTISGAVVYVKPLGDGRAEVHIESNYHIEEGHEHPATYATTGSEAKGKYRVHGKAFNEHATYTYKGIFVRDNCPSTGAA